MEVDPPDWWKRLQLRILSRWPMEPRKKIKRLMLLGDEYAEQGEDELAEECYRLSLEIAEEARAVRLRKKLEQRFQP